MKNLFQIIHIIGAVQAIFLFILLIMRKKNEFANKVLAIIILAISINLIMAFLHNNNNKATDLLASGRSDMFVFFYGPLILYYTLLLTRTKNSFKIKYLLHILPAIAILILLFLTYTILGTSISLWDGNNPFSLKIWYVLHLMALAHLLGYILYGLYVTYQYKRKLVTYFSQHGKINLLWLRVILISLALISMFSVIHFICYRYWEPEGIIQWVVSLSTVLLIFVMGYFTMSQPDILNDLRCMNDMEKEENHNIVDEGSTQEVLAHQENSVKYERNRLDEFEEQAILNRITNYVEDMKPYLNPDLNLKLLAEEISVPSHRLSMLINLYFNQNFYTFINKYRIEEAKKQLRQFDSKSNSIINIAYESGFNSKSTFNAVFKKIEGITPSEYIAQNCKGSNLIKQTIN